MFMDEKLAHRLEQCDANCASEYVNSRLAGGGMLFNMSTIEAHRGRGNQTRLIHRRIEFAQEQGCDLAIVQATPGITSQRNIERAGFKLAYTKVILSC